MVEKKSKASRKRGNTGDVDLNKKIKEEIDD
jgi:hypothetical protein